MIAAVGNDGTRPVVWGIGETAGEAQAEAERWLSEAAGASVAALEYHEITPAQAEAVRRGDVSWPIR